ncbi:ketose-bisphosphate aldolase [Clostridium carboxidivorans P7]|uniref:Ketose-bisphosphate aldolase n=1 Tax=Clostridium carboxidivorans P7 TaxID=536227 RepID=C6PN60_9CLOT|nr:class II fructose-bisphosphate aldolase [Clostridium carboxidivorans]AKN30840.1 ketose-bisphosphate aldolase [Clostridium carboxidivorans P7]EET89393.1 ketose-bisphosphate aldolase [Clostridium carboxidivorans P7]EFG88914.1 putative tagatose-bisphosphate aldolase [Clostridium carboxidivorans P7]
MLVSLCNLLEDAEKKGYAVGAFNTPTLEAVRAVIAGAEELKVPVIISHAEVHESIVPIEIIGPIMLQAAKAAKVPVCVHLDHGSSLDLIYKAMELGFTSVMFDGSSLPYEKNVELTCQVVKDAHLKGVSVEAELGIMTTSGVGGEKIGVEEGSENKDLYTNPDMAADFVKKTNIDALAASFGTAHGIYLKTPKLDYERLSEIRKKAQLPIVMHGGSGVSEDDYRKVIERGVRKINYYTYMSRAAGEAIRKKINASEGDVFYHDITCLAIEAMKQDAMKAMRVFNKMC